MNVKMAAQVIRDQVTMDQILDLYGYKTKHGFMCCPFHGEKEPSLKVYKNTRGWHCFGCERGGSVIDFVMAHENCDFRTAVRAIDGALHLGLMDPHENPEDARREQRLQKSLDDFCDAVYAYCDAMISVTEWRMKLDFQKYKELKARDVTDISAKEWDFLHTFNDEEDYNEYRIEKINEFKEEVAAWRRKARRAR